MVNEKQQVLQAEILGTERAIRHLIGERKALSSKIAREEALIKLDQRRLTALTTKNHPIVSKSGPPLPHGDRFPDVSSWQPSVDVRAVRDATTLRCGQIMLTKLTEGTGEVDQYGLLRLHAMTAAGFPHRAAYHFAHPSESGVVQAEHFLSAGGSELTEADVVVYDCEVTDGEPGTVVAACARVFAQEVRKHVKSKLWIYGGGPFLHEEGVTLDGYDAHHLAAYVGDPAPYMVFGRQRTVSWQFTDGAHGPAPHGCPGIGACDMNILL